MSELERTVDAFAAELRGPRRARRRLVDEVATHLHDSLAEELAAGTPPDAAARAVLDRFGDPHAPAAAWNRDRTARRGAERRNALVLAVAAVAAAALAMSQHASGTNTRPAPARAGTAQPLMPPSHQDSSSRRHATNPR
jgi:HAAS domain-containing protein